MSIEYIVKSPCKINLHLDIHKKRDDGYHNLTSIFQLISLEDEILVTLNSTNKISIIGDFDCKLEDNLIFKAADLFKRISGIDQGFEFKVIKRIPSGGGVGGGSSNCGAVLRFFKYLYPGKLTDKQFFDMALSLGSDVPFFIKYPTAIVQGRGELISELSTITNYYIVTCNPSIHVSTKLAFGKLSEKELLSNEDKDLAHKIKEIYLKGVNNFTFFKNSFEIAMFTDYNFIKDIKTTMISSGAIYSGLSGSGSTMFGVFSTKVAACKAKDLLSKNSNYKIDIVRPLDKFPDIIKRDF